MLRRYLAANRNTRFGCEHHFAGIRDLAAYRQHVPIRTYAEFLPYLDAIRHGETQALTQEDVLYFMPTGGTTGVKLIPYTRTLKQEFQRALAPWLVDIARSFPAILNGQTYWSLTPPGHTLKTLQHERLPVGFEDDTAYFGWKGRLIGSVFAVPGWMTRLTSMENFRFLTLYFLLKAANLRWISIWSPTFWLTLLQELEDSADRLCAALHDGSPVLPEPEQLLAAIPSVPLPHRAAILEQALKLPETERYHTIWPQLVFISQWQDAYAAHPAQQVARLFPQAYCQGKGLLATEGVMTIPCHAAQGCLPAFTSHVFEFIGGDQQARCVWELDEGATYTVVLTTGGGFYRYAIGDAVQVTGFYHNLPILQFIGRTGRCSDLVGEKLDEAFVNRAMETILAVTRLACTFLLLAPETSATPHGYVLFIETSEPTPVLLAFARQLELALYENMQYAFAIRMGQLAPLRVFRIAGHGPATYLQRCVAEGQRLGDIKPLMFDTRTDWPTLFQGHFLDAA